MSLFSRDCHRQVSQYISIMESSYLLNNTISLCTVDRIYDVCSLFEMWRRTMKCGGEHWSFSSFSLYCGSDYAEYIHSE